MWLVLDIGNSAVKGGVFEEERLGHPVRIPLAQEDDPDAWQAAFEAYLRGRPITRAGLASVVPAVTPRVRACIDRLLNVPVQAIHHRMRLPFALAYETPHTMGADRLAVAAGAWNRYGRVEGRTPRPVVALDAGTAVTYEVIDRDGVFRGGAIGAGPELVRRALARGTAQLPAVPLEMPSSPIGRSTQEALQAGIMYAFVEGARGILGRIEAALGERPVVVATGGWGAWLHEHLDGVDHVDPHLVLHGVRVLMALNPTSPPGGSKTPSG